MPSSAWRLVSLSLVLLAFLFIGSPSFPALERAIQKAFNTSVVTAESATTSALLHAAPHPEVVALPSDAPLAPAQRKARILVPLYVSFAALQVLDAHSTIRALNAGATEGNPLMAGLAGKPAAFVAVKAGLAASTILLAEKLRARSRRGAVALMAVLNSVYATIVAHNYRVPR